MRARSIPRRVFDRGGLDLRASAIGLALLVPLALVAALYPKSAGIDPTKMDVRPAGSRRCSCGDKWSWAHPLGTDQIGRDMLVRSLVGLRYSFLIGIASVVRDAVVGCALGTIAGYFGGRMDAIIMRLTDAQLSIPMIILGDRRARRLAPDHTAPSCWCSACRAGRSMRRIMRCIVMTERQREYVRAAKLGGSTDLRIISPCCCRCLPPVLFTSVLDVARMMIFESDPRLPRLGVQPLHPDLRQHHRRRPQISDECLVDRHHARHSSLA